MKAGHLNNCTAKKEQDKKDDEEWEKGNNRKGEKRQGHAHYRKGGSTSGGGSKWWLKNKLCAICDFGIGIGNSGTILNWNYENDYEYPLSIF